MVSNTVQWYGISKKSSSAIVLYTVISIISVVCDRAKQDRRNDGNYQMHGLYVSLGDFSRQDISQVVGCETPSSIVSLRCFQHLIFEH